MQIRRIFYLEIPAVFGSMVFSST